MWNHLQSLEGMEGFILGPFTRQLDWSPDEVQVLLAGVRKDMKDPDLHVYFD
jgi:hypothetical protein